MKKLSIAIIITVLAIMPIIFKLIQQDDKFVEEVVAVEKVDEYSFTSALKKDMRFLPLDYMNEPEIEKCKHIKQTLTDNYKATKFLSPEFVETIDEVYVNIKPLCEESVFKKLFYRNNPNSYIYYILSPNEVLIGEKTPGGVRMFKFFSLETCELDPRQFIASDTTTIATVNGEKFFISDWFDETKYVFYYLTNSPSYYGLNCRFNIE